MNDTEEGWALNESQGSLGLRCLLVADPRFRV